VYDSPPNRDELLDDCRAAKKVLCDYKEIDTALAELQREVEVVTEFSRKAIFENANAPID